MKEVLETAELASSRDPAALNEITGRLTHSHPVVRYWAATAFTVLAREGTGAKPSLQKLLYDPQISVRIAAAEALYGLNEKDAPLKVLTEVLGSDNIMARVHALNVLENMGEDARPALDNIRRLLKEKVEDGDYDVRAAQRIIDNLKTK